MQPPIPPFLRNEERLYFFMVENNNIYNIPQYFAETSEASVRVATVQCIMACYITVKLHKCSCVHSCAIQQIINELILNFLKQKQTTAN